MATRRTTRSRTYLSRGQWLNQQIAEQRQWIEKCGATLSGYVAHYGRLGESNCYGNGGYAIYAADTAELGRLELAKARCRT